MQKVVTMIVSRLTAKSPNTFTEKNKHSTTINFWKSFTGFKEKQLIFGNQLQVLKKNKYVGKFNILPINWYSPGVAHVVQSKGCDLLVE